MITTVIEAAAAAGASSGFNGNIGVPEAFRNTNDVNVSSDIRAFMGPGTGAAGDSTANNTLDFTLSQSLTPSSTRTTRKIKVKAFLIAHMDPAMPAGSFVKAGLEYSLNGGGAYTTIIEYNNVTSNTELGNGAFTEYEILVGISQNITQVRIRAYVQADSGVGGGVSNVSYGRAFAQGGWVEDFESAVNLLTIRPSVCAFTNINNDDPAFRFEQDSGFARDGIASTNARHQGQSSTIVGGATGNSFFTATYPATSIGSGVAHAQLIWDWSGNLANAAGTGTTANSQIRCEWSEFTGQPFSSTSDVRSFESITGTASATHARSVFNRDITSLFRTVDQVTQRINGLRDIGNTPIFSAYTMTTNALIYEMYMEIRVPSSSAGPMAGWEPL